MILVLLAVVTALFPVALGASPARADATPLISGTAWLDGHAVNVCGSSTDTTCGGETHLGGVSSNWYQCVELAQRLYYTRGWYTANNGVFSGVDYAYQIYDNAASLGMTRQANGSITSIVPGDMIVHTSQDGGTFGHVSIVDSISGGTVHAVEENSSATGRADYTLSSGTLSRASLDTHIYGVVHDPDNSKVVFERYSSGVHTIQMRDTQGTLTNLSTNSGGLDDHEPDVSPDGTKIAFVGDRTVPGHSPTTARVLMVMGSDGSSQGTLVAPLGAYNTNEYDYSPSWSPDGTKIAYVKQNGNSYIIAVINADGSGATTLTSGGKEFSPVWRPTQTSGHYRIAYESDTGGGGAPQIFTMKDDGTDRHLVTGSDSGFQDTGPAWSADGTKLYFFSSQSTAGIYYYSSTDHFDTTGNVSGPTKLGTAAIYSAGAPERLKMSSTGGALVYSTGAPPRLEEISTSRGTTISLTSGFRLGLPETRSFT